MYGQFRAIPSAQASEREKYPAGITRERKIEALNLPQTTTRLSIKILFTVTLSLSRSSAKYLIRAYASRCPYITINIFRTYVRVRIDIRLHIVLPLPVYDYV